MNIIKIERYSEEELISRLKNLCMLTAPDVYPYRDAYISLERISTDYITPPQRYVLVGELKKVRDLRLTLMEHGIDVFNLNGYVNIWLEGEETPVTVLPPVVEESIEASGAVVNVINDGMHRLFMARLEWVIPQVIFVRGIPKKLPYYAYPIPDGWKGVSEMEELPPGYIKKWHRIENYKSLYRNFNSVFENVGAPRGYTKK
ncbi:MAG: hypothetical protein HQK89_08855 [Nitrospirae bacterium]|nr:hypothetical protein [Nitrospirota bacterium]